jgi:hypothetical protein
LKDRKELKSLIKDNTSGLTTLRDHHFEISWTYNYGDDYWYIQHDGKYWNINDHLRPSQNQFKTLQEAIDELKTILKDLNDERKPISD